MGPYCVSVQKYRCFHLCSISEFFSLVYCGVSLLVTCISHLRVLFLLVGLEDNDELSHVSLVFLCNSENVLSLILKN